MTEVIDPFDLELTRGYRPEKSLKDIVAEISTDPNAVEAAKAKTVEGSPIRVNSLEDQKLFEEYVKSVSIT